MNYIDLIKKHEGCRLHPYTDSVGKLTIGVGRNLSDNGISQTEADAMLMSDCQQAIKDARSLFSNFDSLNDVRKAVIIDMSFQLGYNHLAQFKNFIAAVNKQDWLAAKTAMLDSVWARQVPTRAIENVRLIFTGTS